MMGRHITTAVTMVVLCGLLVLGVVLGWKSLFAEIPGGDTPSSEVTPPCSTVRVKPGQRIRSSQVQVSVFNGGSQAGLAGDTMKALRKRGFKAGDIGNAPSDAKVRKVQVWSTEEDDAEARLVALQFGKKVRVRFSDVDLGPGVDVVVGDRFRALVKAERFIKVQVPQEVCIPNESADGSADADSNAAG